MPPGNENRNMGKNQVGGKSRNILESTFIFLSYVLLIIAFPIAIFFSITTASEFERIVIFRLGRLRSGRARGPGLIFFLPCVDELIKIDLRTDSFDVPAQAILTKDSVTIKVDAVVYYRISDPIKSVLNAVSPNLATEYLAQTTLRNVAGGTMLADLLASRDELSREILLTMEEPTSAWGVKVERVEVKEITMPKQLQRAMAAEQEASRQAKAKIASADGELKSATVLREASETMALNPIALQLRYLQTLNTVAGDKNRTIVVPFPLDVLRKLSGGSANGKSTDAKPANELHKQRNAVEKEQNDWNKNSTFDDDDFKDANTQMDYSSSYIN